MTILRCWRWITGRSETKTAEDRACCAVFSHACITRKLPGNKELHCLGLSNEERGDSLIHGQGKQEPHTARKDAGIIPEFRQPAAYIEMSETAAGRRPGSAGNPRPTGKKREKLCGLPGYRSLFFTKTDIRIASKKQGMYFEPIGEQCSESGWMHGISWICRDMHRNPPNGTKMPEPCRKKNPVFRQNEILHKDHNRKARCAVL